MFLDQNNVTSEQLELADREPIQFQTNFEGFMEMYSEMQTVAEYLNAHEGWFCRCAQPMTAEPLGNNGYTLTIGRFGSFGYEVEPKMSVILEPPKDRVYLMRSIPVPDYNPPGYEVDYQALMELAEIAAADAAEGMVAIYRKQGKLALPDVITKVKWELHLKVAVRFPKFIYKLPLNLIQTTGDRLLAQIVGQVSPRLSYKVQQDFHSRFGLPIPPKTARKFAKIITTDGIVA
ncbi:MAG: DUF1997 domain-containing protein [Gomphosphaeria aponina SAG 52.96 = DSM 107014]|uniref:DUF1997 domain-containing protein n=1 Tax=Gomphosphaeria aponina SAG 52.96 = DSM 107014 TaxID=1521640 RepID=A0A941GPP8_9CHRO|nr:DUF1997 domain-containing protein [Gomphosphaeria aponina SAG 52.96 = DSM 107014]